MKSSLSEIVREAHRQGLTYGEYVATHDCAEVDAISKVEEGRKRCARLNETEAARLYDEGLKDAEIAMRLGCVDATVCKWRKRTGRVANTKRGKRQC